MGDMSAARPPSFEEIAEAQLWAELAQICRLLLHSWLVNGDGIASVGYLRRLDRILNRLPKDDMAIVRQDALAWLNQLRGDRAAAIRFRREEIRLMELLHEDVRRNLGSGKYSQSAADYILEDRDQKDLEERRMMLRALQEAEANDEGWKRGRGRKEGRD
jgi:hypothetical protein